MKKVMCGFICLALTLFAMGETPTTNTDLYTIGVREITLPLETIRESYAKFGWLQSPKLIVDVYQNNAPIWRTPPIPHNPEGNTSTFRYDLKKPTNCFPTFLSSTDEFIFKVILVDPTLEVRIGRGVAGAVGGAALGTAIGVGIGVVGTTLSGGSDLGASIWLGAKFGFWIGGILGGAGGATLPAESSLPIVEFKLKGQDLFGEHTTTINAEGLQTKQLSAHLTLAGQQVQSIHKDGGLKAKGTKYVVRLREIHLSSDLKGVKDDGEYYMEVDQFDNDRQTCELGKIPLDTDYPLPSVVAFVLANKMGTGEVRIYRDKVGKDPLVFSVKQGASATGETWLYQGKTYGDDRESYVLFETFSLEDISLDLQEK